MEERKSHDPRCALHYAEAAFLKGLLIGTDASKNEALDRLRFAEEMAESYVKTLEPYGNRILELRGVTITPSEATKLIKAV